MRDFPPLVSRLVPNLARENPHEVIAVRDAISRALVDAGLSWHDVAIALARQGGAPPTFSPLPPSFGDMARAARDLDRGQLSPRERTFVVDMCRQGFSFRPSPRQSGYLADILARLQRRAA